MASYTRQGSYLLAVELTADPCGKINRGLTFTSNGFERHYLIRTFSEELLESGLGAKLAEAARAAGLLAGTRGFGTNYAVETGKSPHIVCDYVPGRSLAQVLKKTREEQIPLGVDHALSVLQGMAQSVLLLHSKGLQHGTLSPHSVWISYEGAAQLLDAPYAAILQGLLPKAHQLAAQLTPYRNAAAGTPLQQDLFALGAMLYELLTLDRLPETAAIPAALAQATLKGAQEEEPIPAEILELLKSLLLVGQPFATAAAFNERLEKVLYDGEYSPTTFNMAFFMHTLFREEADADAQAMKSEQAADFTPFLVSTEGSRRVLEGNAADSNSSLKKYTILGGCVLVVIFGALFLSNRANARRNADLQEKIVALQRENATNDAKLLDLGKAQEAQKQIQDQLSKKAVEGKTAEERAKAKKDLEEARLKTDELARQREEAMRKRTELNSRTSVIAQIAPAAQVPVPEPAKVEPAPAPAAAAAAAAAIKPAPAASTEIVEVPVTVVKKVAPMVPRMANKNLLPPGLRDTEIRVSLKVFVDIAGRPLKVVILNGVDGSFGFNDAAQNAALASAYAPATRNGKPITGWLAMDYVFPRVR